MEKKYDYVKQGDVYYLKTLEEAKKILESVGFDVAKVDLEEMAKDLNTIYQNAFYIQMDADNKKVRYLGTTSTQDSNNFNCYYKNLNTVNSRIIVLNDVMTFSEAAEKWNIDSSTLRKLVNTDKLIKDVDYRKSGSVWLITKEAMEKVYGKEVK